MLFTVKGASTAAALFDDALKIAVYSKSFGPPFSFFLPKGISSNYGLVGFAKALPVSFYFITLFHVFQ